MNKQPVAIFIRWSDEYDVLSRDLNVLYSDNEWRNIYIAFPTHWIHELNDEDIPTICDKLDISKLIGKNEDDILEVCRNFMLNL